MPTSSIRLTLKTSQEILGYTKIVAPVLVLVVFLVAFIAHGVVTAPPPDDVEVHARLGPGGRPLPKRRQSSQQVKKAAKVRDFSPNVKLLFNWLGLFALMTFAANAVLIILQTVIKFREKWWPGQAAVVSSLTVLPEVWNLQLTHLDLCCSIFFCVGHHSSFAD